MNCINVNNHKVTPSKIMCIGRNYVDHITELGNEVPNEMVVFLKPNSAISTDLHAVHQEPLHFEGELCFVYQDGKFSAVGFGLDLTKRTLQSKLKAKGLPWERAKAFDGSAVFSDFVAIDTIDETLSLELTINSELAQQGGVLLMMYKPSEILSELQKFMTLENGDVVMTGTPKGVGEIKQGAVFKGRVLVNNQEICSSSWIAK
ncbi:fumarylacetoacetate hydrolase family protein [Thalassotalea profundi]|uniref:2-keto-4-pentenoate hydratase n=1 Tax=Thalassotalea profundi TaxID=2036687 RepID=A0ABQ3J779_9GAMM|nr:fumarylacetoacetate hydrolase family protein [Thalassotalea profundi]GHF01457.1 2-keto-4-pentenoate hydratase [Thalassotalea profundi]